MYCDNKKRRCIESLLGVFWSVWTRVHAIWTGGHIDLCGVCIAMSINLFFDRCLQYLSTFQSAHRVAASPLERGLGECDAHGNQGAGYYSALHPSCSPQGETCGCREWVWVSATWTLVLRKRVAKWLIDTQATWCTWIIAIDIEDISLPSYNFNFWIRL